MVNFQKKSWLGLGVKIEMVGFRKKLMSRLRSSGEYHMTVIVAQTIMLNKTKKEKKNKKMERIEEKQKQKNNNRIEISKNKIKRE